MCKYNDFDLDMKVVSDGDGSGTKSSIWSHNWCPSRGCTKKCTDSKRCFPVPTKDYPAHSCFYKNNNDTQTRC